MNEEPSEQNAPPPEQDIPPPTQDVPPPAQDISPPEEQQTRPRSDRRIYVTSSVVSALTAALIVGLVFGGLAVNDALTEDSEPIVQAVAQPAQAAATPTPLPAVVENVSIDDDPILGPEDAPVTIVEFSDFQCPYCQRSADEVLPLILQQYPEEVRLVYRDFPLTQIHSQALPAALAAECADDQGKFWEYHDLLFANQSALDDVSLKAYAAEVGLDAAVFDQCYTSQEHLDEVRLDYQDGLTYGVSGTPAFFVNGLRIVGAQPFSVFQQAIEEALAES